METLANIATDLRIVQEPFEELIRSDQTTLLGGTSVNAPRC